MFPEEISPLTQSNAERQLFARLQVVEGDWAFGLHSLNIAEHVWKRVGEIDFLICGERGLFVLEVKGGRISCNAGVWSFRDRYGNTRKRRESPFSQARSAMFSLQHRLEEMVEPALTRRTVFGYGVVFPDQEFMQESVEWAPEMVLDRPQLDRQDGVRRSLGRLASYWGGKPGAPRSRLTQRDLDVYLQALRPDFDAVPTLRQVTAVAEAELARLTSNQYRALDAHLRNPRVVFEGGAGTGKTMLAAEICRRRSQAGDRVLFTCYSDVIADFILAQPGMDHTDVITFPRLGVSARGPYDVVVVDEAQDVINFDDLAILDRLVGEGLGEGRWLLFLDSNNQRGLIGSYDSEAMEYLLSFRPAMVDLLDNCRNTAAIVADTRALTGADVGVSTAGRGPRVRFAFAKDPESRAAGIAHQLQQYEADGVPLADVALLSPMPFEQSTFARLAPRWRARIDPLDARARAQRPDHRPTFATVAQFKGLESPFVILTDICAPTPSGEPPTELYVGMTRARVGLSVVMDAADEDRIRAELSAAGVPADDD